MIDTTHVDQPTAARRVTSLDPARPEPSHIHIPRPSRLKQMRITQRDETGAITAQLQVALEQAA